jgi:hypothetical protein
VTSAGGSFTQPGSVEEIPEEGWRASVAGHRPHSIPKRLSRIQQQRPALKSSRRMSPLRPAPSGYG